MARYTNTAEAGQAPGTVVANLSQTGGTAGDAFTGTQSLFDGGSGGVQFSADAAHGAASYQLGYLNSTGAGGWRGFTWLVPQAQWDLQGRLAARWYQKFGALAPSGMVMIGDVRNQRPTSGGLSTDSGSAVAFTRTASGALEVRPGGATRAVAYTSPAVLQAGRYYRFETYVKANSAFGVADGVIEFAAYEGDSPEPIAYWRTDTADTRGTYEPYGNQIPTGMVFGQSTSGSGQTPYARQEWWDDMVMLTGADATGLPGPVLPNPVSTAHPYVVTRNPGGWSPVSAPDIITALSDGSDNSYALSPGLTANEVLEVAIPPLTSGSLRVSGRARRGSTAATFKVEVLQGASTVVATRTYTAAEAVAGFELVATPTELAKITDRSRLRVRVTGNPG